MDWSTLPLIILRLALLLAGLLLPGSMLLRALRLPWSLAAAFLTSSAALYAVVLVFACTGAAISLATLAAGLGLVTLLAALVPARGGAAQNSQPFAWFGRMGWWLPLYGAFWLIVAYRLVAQPLDGPDVTFRWSWLAEQMLQFRSLDFYPPGSGADFVRYFWAESIPPGIAGLYAWAYACAGSKHALWTSPVVGLQILALHELVWRLGDRWGGEVVARRAVLLAAACPLLTWSVILGQETGLAAVAVTGLVWSLHNLSDDDGGRRAMLAGLFAIVAASTREYGVVFPVAAIAGAALLKAPRGSIGLLALVALPVAAAWPLRVWALTGNPFYSLDVAGLFPTNRVFNAWNDTLRSPFGEVLSSVDTWKALGRYLLLWALPAAAGLVLLAVLLVRRLREARAVSLFVVLMLGIWALSVGYTAGGLFYSLRVMAPAFALLAVVAGYGVGLLPGFPVAARIAAVAGALVLAESLPKTLVLPENPYRAHMRDWFQSSQQIAVLARAYEQAVLEKLQPLPDRRRILSDRASAPRLFASIGTEVVPLWSPEVAWLFDESLNPADVAALWRKSGLRYVVLGNSGPTAGFLQARVRWLAPHITLREVATAGPYVILEATASPPR